MSDEGVEKELALSDIRIIDFGVGGIDPLTTGYLADFGAEVIKVESNTAIDFIRRSEWFAEDTRDLDSNMLFGRYNQNKLGVLINLKHPKGVELAKKLVSVADVVMENLAFGTLNRLGLGYEELIKVKPDIIMVSAYFGGQTGPYRDFRGIGGIMSALQGLNDLTGWPDRWPVQLGDAFGDHYLPWMWAVAILAALDYHRQTGKGQFIDASSFEGCLDILDTAVADYSVNDRVLKRRGNHHPTAAPHGVYRCKGDDRWCAIAVFSDEEWQSFCHVLGSPAWISEEKFSTLLGRLKNVDELEQLVEEWTRGQKAEDVALKLQEAGVAAEVVKNIEDLHKDPQLAHREHYWESPEPGMEPFTFEAPSARLSETPARFQRRYPFMGEHSYHVFCKLLGLDANEYNRLVEEKVIY
ncbi:CaiB/BaiF CoA transferase family protein [Chloroflexota bacterium]